MNAYHTSDYTKIDLHTHTCASGHAATDTITDMAREAAARKMTVLGISDHGPATAGSANLSYFQGLRLCEKKRFGIRILYGAEANILDKEGHLDIPDNILAALDYCIISMHRPIYTSGSAAENTRAYINAMKRPKVRIIGHCDDARFPVDYTALVRAAKEYQVYPELNNVSLLPGSYRKSCTANSQALLNSCEALGCPVFLSSDSHGRASVGEVRAARELAALQGFPEELLLKEAPFFSQPRLLPQAATH